MSSKEQFEAWFYASKYAQVAPPTKAAEQAAWDGWQASRAELVVELPTPTMSQYANRHSYNCAVEALGWAKEAIESQGIQVKQ
jgi:hypothetical protein